MSKKWLGILSDEQYKWLHQASRLFDLRASVIVRALIGDFMARDKKDQMEYISQLQIIERLKKVQNRKKNVIDKLRDIEKGS